MIADKSVTTLISVDELLCNSFRAVFLFSGSLKNNYLFTHAAGFKGLVR
ncbi:MAG: hypothetical protein IJV35_08160 [Neisseriaceae bacterium]|nr:hypothetical protein [Neisseriaceae bacterium]